MSETAKFRRMDEGKKKRQKTYRKEKQAKEERSDGLSKMGMQKDRKIGNGMTSKEN